MSDKKKCPDTPCHCFREKCQHNKDGVCLIKLNLITTGEGCSDYIEKKE